jgi:hypothetical protein
MTAAAELWDRLAEAGMVEGAMPEPREAAAPWYVRAMVGVAGWIAACFLIGFLVLALSLESHGSNAAVVGLFCCGGAFFLFRQFDGQDFVEQLALAVSLAGQALIAFGLGDMVHPGDAAFYLMLAIVEAVLVVAVPNFLHRVLAGAGACGALALAFGDMGLPGLASPVLCAALAAVWLEPRVWALGGSLWRPVGYGAVLALLLTETFHIVDADAALFGWRASAPTWMALHGPLIGRAVAAAILIFVALRLALREGVKQGSGLFAAIAAGAVLLAAFSLAAPGLASALLILLLGFAAGSRLLVGVGILSLLGFVFHFYYSLQATLLEKSGLMALAAFVLLGLHFAFRRLGGPVLETADA